jgi:hypothetical protein
LHLSSGFHSSSSWNLLRREALHCHCVNPCMQHSMLCAGLHLPARRSSKHDRKIKSMGITVALGLPSSWTMSKVGPWPMSARQSMRPSRQRVQGKRLFRTYRRYRVIAFRVQKRSGSCRYLCAPEVRPSRYGQDVCQRGSSSRSWTHKLQTESFNENLATCRREYEDMRGEATT